MVVTTCFIDLNIPFLFFWKEILNCAHVGIHVGIHGSVSLLLCKDEVLKPSETDGLVDRSCGNFIRC